MSEAISAGVLKKYENGVEYLMSDWIGNDALKLGTTFSGKKKKGFTAFPNI